MRSWDKEYILEDLLKENIISLDRGRVISSVDLAKYPGVFPVYSSSSQKNGLFGCYDRYDFDEELITWSVDGGGYFFYRPKHKFSVTNVSGVLKINKPELFDYKFLYYNLAFQHASQYYDYSDKAHPSVIKKQYLIPKIDLDEQQKIASILSKLDEAITQTEQLIGKYKKIKEGLMHDLLTRGIDEQGNIRSEGTHKFKDSPLGRIPVEWEYGSLSTIYELRTGTTPLRANENYFSEKGYNWAKTLDLNEYYINATEEKVTDLALERTSLKLMPKDTILVAMYGGWEQIGRTSILNVEAGTNQAIVSLCNPKIQLQAEFTLFFLQENRWRWKQYAVSTRKDPNITKDDVANFIIAHPKCEKEQKDIVRIIQKVHNQIDLYKEQCLKYNLQKSGLMHDLLTGKIRVSNCEEQNEQTSNVNIVPLKTQAHNQHIEDAVLIGAIVNAFYSDKYTLGRKKVQKLLYLVRRHQEASVACFKKKAAGPYADEVRYKGGEPIAKANKYITTKTNNLGTVFSKGENTEKALAYIEKWEMLSDIDWLLTQFKYTKVDQLELIATIDMARCDLEKEGTPVSLSTIKHLIATNEEWKAKLKKDYFDDFSIQRGIDESYKLFGE